MNHKPLFLATALIALLVIAGAFCWMSQKQQAAEEQLLTQGIVQEDQKTQIDEIESLRDLIDGEYVFTPVDTSDWQTYSDTALGYELRFPQTIKKKVNEQAFIEASENGVSFYVTPYDRLRERQLNDIDESSLIDETFSPYIGTGDIEVMIRQAKVNDTQIRVVKYLFKREPKNHSIEAWSEGYSVEEAFFQCKEDVCAIRTIFDQFSQEKETLFYRIISTMRMVE